MPDAQELVYTQQDRTLWEQRGLKSCTAVALSWLWIISDERLCFGTCIINGRSENVEQRWFRSCVSAETPWVRKMPVLIMAAAPAL